MGVQLFKGGAAKVFSEYSYLDQLKAGWSLEDPALEEVESDEEEGQADIVENWVHSGDLPDNPTDDQVRSFATSAEVPYAAMKNTETLKKDLGYENQG